VQPVGRDLCGTVNARDSADYAVPTSASWRTLTPGDMCLETCRDAGWAAGSAFDGWLVNTEQIVRVADVMFRVTLTEIACRFTCADMTHYQR
jgi:hypothetical protein